MAWQFLNEPSWPAAGPAPAAAPVLLGIWDVDADGSYVVHRSRPEQACLVAVRTLAGGGRLVLDPGGEIACGPESLLVLENERIRHYRTEGAHWRFWWFCFRLAGPPFFPLHQAMAVPRRTEDEAAFAEVFAALRREAFAWRSLASAGFGLLLQRWMAGRQEALRRGPHAAALERVIELMHGRTTGAWSVAAMAREAHLSERRFRQVFRAHTGQSPKQYHDGLRLELGRALLGQGALRVGEVAWKLGFSSPFHFSRAYARRFKAPPRDALAGRDAGSAP